MLLLQQKIAYPLFTFSIQQVLLEATKHYTDQPRTDWVRAWPGQAVLAITQYYWTQMMHTAIRGGHNVCTFCS